jgi:Zn-dependent protease
MYQHKETRLFDGGFPHMVPIALGFYCNQQYNGIMLSDFNLPVFIVRAITLVLAFTVHEFSHAFVADRFGDNTPRLAGRLTLNPLAHLDVFGSLMLLIAGFGWAKPVPINPFLLNLRSRWAEMWVSLAGPLSNLGLAILAAIILRLGIFPHDVNTTGLLPSPYLFLIEFLIINITLAIFNLIPISPLDGEKVLTPFLPPSFADFMNRVRPYGPLFLLILIAVLPRFGIDLISWILGPIMQLILTVLVG